MHYRQQHVHRVPVWRCCLMYTSQWLLLFQTSGWMDVSNIFRNVISIRHSFLITTMMMETDEAALHIHIHVYLRL
jgi:hypothetical protein